MKAVSVSLLTLLTLIATQSQAECAYPKSPASIPNASSASEADMVAAMSEFKHYNAEVDAYLACLDAEVEGKAKDGSAVGSILQFKAMQQKKKASATEERDAKVTQFNEQVRLFKSRKS